MPWGRSILNSYDVGQVAFKKIAEIGQDGKNSKTFTAHDLQLNADIVIKQIAKASLASADDFFNESRALYASLDLGRATMDCTIQYHERGEVQMNERERRRSISS